MNTGIEDPFNLLEIERGLRELESTGGIAAMELKKWRLDLVEKKKALRAARYQAMFRATGTVQMKAAFVDQETNELQYEVELAEVQVKYGVDIVEDRSSKRSALQTRAKLAVEALRLAGYGGGA